MKYSSCGGKRPLRYSWEIETPDGANGPPNFDVLPEADLRKMAMSLYKQRNALWILKKKCDFDDPEEVKEKLWGYADKVSDFLNLDSKKQKKESDVDEEKGQERDENEERDENDLLDKAIAIMEGE